MITDDTSFRRAFWQFRDLEQNSGTIYITRQKKILSLVEIRHLWQSVSTIGVSGQSGYRSQKNIGLYQQDWYKYREIIIHWTVIHTD
jgi:hypothetical protein